MRMTCEAAARIDEVLAGPDHVLRVLGPFDPCQLRYASLVMAGETSVSRNT